MPAGPYFEIQADDPARAMRFYKRALAWSFRKQRGLPIDYWSILDDGESIGGLLARPAKRPPISSGTNAFVCSFEVVGYDRVAAKIEKAGAKVALPKFAVPGKCWQGYFVDPEGNTFGIFEPDPKAAGPGPATKR